MENNKLEVFTNEEFGSVRTITINGEPWFVSKDVAAILGYSNTQKAVRDHVDAEDKLTERIVLSGQNREVIVINESGLYSLILSSKLPSAKRFKHWVTNEVLPSIRKHGAYMTDNLLDAVIANPEVMQQVVDRLNAERQESQKRLEEMQRELIAAMPKAVYFDTFVNPEFATNFRDTAKEFGIPQKCFINLLIDHKLIYRTQKNELRPYAEPLKDGLFVLRDYTSPINFHQGTYTLVTAKGKKHIYEYFTEKGII